MTTDPIRRLRTLAILYGILGVLVIAVGIKFESPKQMLESTARTPANRHEAPNVSIEGA